MQQIIRKVVIIVQQARQQGQTTENHGKRGTGHRRCCAIQTKFGKKMRILKESLTMLNDGENG